MHPLYEVDTLLQEKIRLVGRQIGNTPLHAVTRVFSHNNVRIYAKMEWAQLSGSVKARAAYHIIRAAVERGDLRPGKILLDATSGNTGIAYAAIGQALDLPVTLCLPENASVERKEILTRLGAEIIYTSKFEGTDGAQEVARELAEQYPDRYYYADQYKNDQNWKAHYHFTAVEILEQCPDITHFAAGLGTTGTFTGTGRRLAAERSDVARVALQPDNALHGLEGWKHLETAVVPGIYDPAVATATLEIDTLEAYEMMKAAYRYEGLRLSPSSAANLVGAVRLAEQLDHGVVVTILPDNADKYSEVWQKICP